MKSVYKEKGFKTVSCEDVPNLGSIITLDNKGRLINSQFSKPSSSQTLLKLNSTEEVPDADDLPYSIISYGDTPNIINLPYNDHNYASFQTAKKLENYDQKALEYVSKQSTQSLSNRPNFPTNNAVRISHFSSYNSCTSQNDSVFFGDKYKPQHQFSFNQQISHSSTPIVTSKAISNNSIYGSNKLRPGAIVINSGSVNKVKGMSVIQLRRPTTMDTSGIGDPRIVNLPIKKPSVLTNIVGNNQINGAPERTDVNKSINLVPRCVCGFTHDDGGMIRCEVCRTWQHIVCMYPDNKFPIYYKCDRCEPRDVDVKHAVSTQTNTLLKTGYNPSDFLARQHYIDYDLDNDLENSFMKSKGSHFMLVQPEKTGYRSLGDTLPNTTVPIFISATKDVHIVPPGSPRTSKRKQDLISLKGVLSRPNSVIIHSGKVEPQNQLLVDQQTHYSCTPTFFVPTSSHTLHSDLINEPFVRNEMSTRLRSVLGCKVQLHTNLTMYHLQYLKQHNFILNTNMYEVISLDFTHCAVKAVVDFNANEVIMEYNGYVSLLEEYHRDCDFRKHYNPFVLFYEKCDHLQLCVDSKLVDNKARYVRRSCTPNAEVKHRLLQDGQIKFYVVPINRIHRGSEITIAFDYNFMKCQYPVECACNQDSCQLIYLKSDIESQFHMDMVDLNNHNMNMYECTNFNLGAENARAPLTMTRPYKRRGRGSKILNSISRPIIENLTVNIPPVNVVRRNKRGRPPLNRSVGIQRSDVLVKPSSDSTSNNNFSDLKDLSDNESLLSQSNENIHPRMTIHTNFKNFKRISSNHWSLKANRKMAAIVKKSKPLKKLLITPKAGRPMKIKKPEVIKVEHEEKYFIDNSPRTCNALKVAFDSDHNSVSNEENEDSTSPHSNKHELSREEEGKYWLEEINNKILKQKVKEAKRIQRKSKYSRKKISQRESEEVAVVEDIKFCEPDIKSPEKEVKEEVVVLEEEPEIPQEEVCVSSPVRVDSPTDKGQTVKKQKRGRKSQKPNTSYILSYRPSNFDDLKNDLMLISASLEEDVDKEVEVQDTIKKESEVDLTEVIVEETDLRTEESVALAEESVEHAEEPSSESLEHTAEKSATTESDASNKFNDSFEELHNRSRNRRSSVNRSSDSGKDMSTKASREERWVNIMWQRILKNETPDDRLKRRRSKGSAADGSVASEDNRNESSEIGSPKIGNPELPADRDSSIKSSSVSKKSVSKTRLSTNEHEGMQGDHNKLPDVEKSIAGSGTSTTSVEEHQTAEVKESSEQCGLIVYKEQHANPMEKFSRENSARLFSPESNTEVPPPLPPGNANHPPHKKKRWLSQALMDETIHDGTPVPKSEAIPDSDIVDKFSSIDHVSKRSFLPPVLTTADNTDLSSSSVHKVAINPKKRLLNQFSLEDSCGQRSRPDSGSAGTSAVKSSKSESNADQEQSKTKLTLTEYRKRRFIDKMPGESSNVAKKYHRHSHEFNSAWVGLPNLTPKVEQVPHEEVPATARREKSLEASAAVELSYLETLNNLTMPASLDPRLSKVSNGNKPIPIDLRVIFYRHSTDAIKQEVFETKSPSDTPNSTTESRPNKAGPRTPSEVGEMVASGCLLGDHNSEGSVHSFESQPSPTSDSHFDFERETLSVMEIDKLAIPTEPWAADWTSHTTTIGKMAGIKNPDLLQEIEEFEDEYVPMPEKLPERSKEEIETLLLTQKRDSQIREWQEVKQMEREKVKLDHQVRSMERRLHRANKQPETKVAASHISNNSVDGNCLKNAMANYDVKDDEKTMKTFNVQLASINDKLLEQIKTARNNNAHMPATAAAAGGEQLSTTAPTTRTHGDKAFARHRKKPTHVHTQSSEIRSAIV